MDLRRSRVNELYSQGYSQPEIAKDTMKRHLTERVPEEYQKCLIGLNLLLKETWSSLPQTDNMAEKIRVLTLALEIYIKKIMILANPTLTDKAIKVKSIPNDVNFSPKLTEDTQIENDDVQTNQSDRDSLEKGNNQPGDPGITDGVF